MRLTRHARNRLRLIRRASPDVTVEAVLTALGHGGSTGYDDLGNERVSVGVGSVDLIVVVDPARRIVITMWRVG